ncbi:MAG: polysaccharide biosynthesis/export family protein [Candidatus Cybelea sp.]
MFWTVPATTSAQAPPYTIHADDQLAITVFGAPSLSQTVTVLSDGTISYPLIGTVKVGGLTPDEATAALRSAFSRYVIHPVVGLGIVKSALATIEVLGAVDRGGAIEIQNGDRLVDALAKAGVGPTSFADLNHVTVNRLVDGKPLLYNVNVYNMLLNADYASNMVLRPGDVVYVPKARQRNYTNLPIALYYLYLLATPGAR